MTSRRSRKEVRMETLILPINEVIHVNGLDSH